MLAIASCPQNALMHEDIDGAVFVCWKFFAGMAILITPQVYRRVLDNAMKQERNGLSAFCTHGSYNFLVKISYKFKD